MSAVCPLGLYTAGTRPSILFTGEALLESGQDAEREPDCTLPLDLIQQRGRCQVKPASRRCQHLSQMVTYEGSAAATPGLHRHPPGELVPFKHLSVLSQAAAPSSICAASDSLRGRRWQEPTWLVCAESAGPGTALRDRCGSVTTPAFLAPGRTALKYDVHGPLNAPAGLSGSPPPWDCP